MPANRPSAAARLNRRVVLKAAAALGAFAAAGTLPRQAKADASSGTAAVDWRLADHPDAADALAYGGGIVVEPGQSFTAVGAFWDGGDDAEPTVSLQVSLDGDSFSDPATLGAGGDEGRPTKGGRRFTGLLFTQPAVAVRCVVTDANGQPLAPAGFGLAFIDASAGPSSTDGIGSGGAASGPPQVISRAGWGADESLRFGDDGEIWPPEYAPVGHVIIHHTDTANGYSDPAAEIRAIYYYHAVVKGWGDIAYNYLVDRFGNIYEGRVGGQNVVGGHSYQYQVGSSGIALLGNFRFAEIPDQAQAALVAIVAWVARGLDPEGASDFWERSNVPTICGHRDVQDDTDCPGDALYQDLPTIRDYVAAAFASAPSGYGAGFVTGDAVVVATDDGGNLRLRTHPGLSHSLVASLADGSSATVTGGPVSADGWLWCALDTDSGSGWAVADYLALATPDAAPAGRFAVGDNVAVAIDGGNLRNGPGLDFSVDAELPLGTPGLVIVGPHVIDGHVWYQLDTPVDIGWMADAILAPAGDVAPPAGDPAVGDAVKVATDRLRVHSGPGLSYDVVGVLTQGAAAAVTDGPRAADGHAWYQLDASAASGWVAAEFLAKA